MQRLRLAYQVAGLIAESKNSPAIVQACFQGVNPHLEDRSPTGCCRKTTRTRQPAGDCRGAGLRTRGMKIRHLAQGAS